MGLCGEKEIERDVQQNRIIEKKLEEKGAGSSRLASPPHPPFSSSV